MSQTVERPTTVTNDNVRERLGSTGLKHNGPAIAALLAAGIGVAALGLLTTIAAANANFANLLKINAAVGPLSGKTTYSVGLFFATWLVLGIALRGKSVNERRYLVATFGLIGLGILGTFPVFYDLFVPK